MRLTLFIGGPLYSLSVVLPAILIGYSTGSLLAGRLLPRARAGGVLLTALYAFAFIAFAVSIPSVMASFMGSETWIRVGVAAAFTAPFGVVLGLAVPWYMETLKADADTTGALAWMWGVNSAGNVIGSMMFVPLCHAVGVRDSFMVAGAFYVVALLWGTLTLAKPAQTAR
jgi:predicted MFS family arabinose efflux permease